MSKLVSTFSKIIRHGLDNSKVFAYRKHRQHKTTDVFIAGDSKISDFIVEICRLKSGRNIRVPRWGRHFRKRKYPVYV